MKFNNLALGTSLIVILVACKATFPNSKKQRKEKAYWESLVSQPSTDSAIKGYWVELIDGRWDYFEKKGIDLAEKDVSALKFIKLLSYTIDSIGLSNYNGLRSLSSFLTLDKNDIVTFAVKNGAIVAMIYPRFENGKWINAKGYGVPFQPVANAIYEIAKSGGEVYNVKVIAFPGSKTVTRQCLITNKNRQLMSIGSDGKLRPFDDELMAIKKDVMKTASEEKSH
ncbi:MAG: hypothetical protein ABIX01_13565 [Chitinophagaceae bacterium]